MASIAGLDNRVLAMIYVHLEPAADNSAESVLVISLEGEIDQEAAPYLDRALVRAFAGGTTVCCDLSGTVFFGTAGAIVLLDAAQHARDEKKSFVLRGVHGTAQRILDAVGLDHRSLR
jgi:anti-anti-sigma factor